MPRTLLLSLLVLVLSACAPGDDRAALAQDNVQLVRAFPALSFTNPVGLIPSGDGSGRLFVTEQIGVIRVFAGDNAAATAAVFLDIRDRVATGGEKGLLGLAFHPNFKDNGYFYVNYTAPNPLHTHVSRFTATGNPRSVVDPASEVELLSFEQPYDNHNGGQLAFGPDGYLYVATGDGGAGGDPQNNAQNRTTLLGKILRIDVDGGGGGRNYGIPADNPYVGNTQGFREEIWAYGLRNPWRFSFDAATGRLWAADVGQGEIEEINLITKGGNFGWKIREGSQCYEPKTGCASEGLIMPAWEYRHNVGQSVTGGYVYRGADIPALQGAYVYGDYVSGRVWALRKEGDAAAHNTELMDTDFSISSFGVDARGELYLVHHGGTLHRFVAAPSTGVQRGDLPTARRGGAVYPNPFSDVVTVSYALDQAQTVSVQVVDVLGRVVYARPAVRQAPGEQRLTLGASELRLAATGAYFVRVLADGKVLLAAPVVHRR